jgi:hypothetical protein
MNTQRDGFVQVAYSEHPVAAIGAGEIAAELLDGNYARPDVLFVFITKPFAGTLEDIAPALRRLLSPTTLLGCVTEQIIGPDGWLIDGPCIQVLAVNRGEVDIVRYAPGDVIVPPAEQTMVLLADPNTTEISLLTDLCGGYSTQLVLNDQLYTDGAIGVIFPPHAAVHKVTDTHKLTTDELTQAHAILAFSEIEVDKLMTSTNDDEVPPVLSGFISRRSFPKTLTVFD